MNIAIAVTGSTIGIAIRLGNTNQMIETGVTRKIVQEHNDDKGMGRVISVFAYTNMNVHKSQFLIISTDSMIPFMA